MGNAAEQQEVTIEKQTPEEIAEAKEKDEAEAKVQAEADAKAEAEKAEQAEADKAEAETAKRTELEAEGKTPEEIDEAIKALSVEPEEIEIVREGTQAKTFTQQELDNVVSNRVKRLNKKVDKSTEQSEASAGELTIEKEKNKLLQIALEQAKGKGGGEVTAPNPDDFDLGGNDPEFIKKQGEFNAQLISEEVAKQVAAVNQTAATDTGQTQKAEALERKQTKHYERAAEIGAKDYEETEDKALEILGNDVANHVIDNFDDSHILLYYMGKNPTEAQRIADLINGGSVIKAVAELGRLSSELKIRPKGKITPDPDEELNGDGSPDQSSLKRKLEKLREEAGETGDMAPLMAFKKKHTL